MPHPLPNQLDAIVRSLSPLKGMTMSELLQAVRERNGGAWIGIGSDIAFSMLRCKCARTACDDVGSLSHRDLAGLYCANCARMINRVNGVQLISCLEGCDHRGRGCSLSCYEEGE